MSFDGDPVSFGGLFHQGVQCIIKTQVGQVVLSARRAIQPPGRVHSDVAAAATSGSSRCVRTKGCCKRKLCVGGQEVCRGVENGVSDAETAFFDGSLCSEPSLLSDGDLDASAETVLEESLRFESTEEETVRRHRESMAPGLAPAEAKRGRGRWLQETGGGRHESLGTVQLFLEVAMGRSLGSREQRPGTKVWLGCRTLWRLVWGLPRLVLFGSQQARPVASWEPPTVPSSKKKAVKSTGLLIDSACVRPLRDAFIKAQGKVEWALGGHLVALLFCLGSFPFRKDLGICSVSKKDLARPGATRRISRRKDLSIWMKAISKSVVRRRS